MNLILNALPGLGMSSDATREVIDRLTASGRNGAEFLETSSIRETDSIISLSITRFVRGAALSLPQANDRAVSHPRLTVEHCLVSR